MSADSRRLVLDSWAIMALMENEQPAMARVEALLRLAIVEDRPAHMSVINLGEVYYSCGRRYGQERAIDALRTVREIAIEILPVDEPTVLQAAGYKMRYPISYADSFALSAAIRHNATLVTGDSELIALSDIVAIEPLQRHR